MYGHYWLSAYPMVWANIYAQYYDFSADSDGKAIYYTARGTSATVVNGDEKYSGDVNIPATVSYDGKVHLI